MTDRLNIELLLTKQGELLTLYENLEGIVSIPLDLNTSEGQGWVRAISYRIVQELTEADLACWELHEDNRVLIEMWPPEEELVDAMFYYLELVILTNFQTKLQEWDFLSELAEHKENKIPYLFPIEYATGGFPGLFWLITTQIGKLNQALRRREWRENGEEIDLAELEKILKQIWHTLCIIFYKRELTAETIEAIYLSKWEVNYRRAKAAEVERELQLQKAYLNPPKERLSDFVKGE